MNKNNIGFEFDSVSNEIKLLYYRHKGNVYYYKDMFPDSNITFFLGDDLSLKVHEVNNYGSDTQLSIKKRFQYNKSVFNVIEDNLEEYIIYKGVLSATQPSVSLIK